MRCSQSAISKIRQICSKWSNWGSKTKTSERQLNRILISNWFANCGKISKAWNDPSVAVSWSSVLQRLHQVGYDSSMPDLKPLLTFKQKPKCSMWAKRSSKLVCWSMKPGHLYWQIKILYFLWWLWLKHLEEVTQEIQCQMREKM